MGERIRLPDGTYITIPDDATPEERARIAAQLAQRFNIPAHDERRATQPPSRQPTNPLAIGEGQNPFATAGSGNPFALGAEGNPFSRSDSGGIASLNPSSPRPGGLEEYTGEKGTLAGSAWEGIKSIPRGAKQFLIMAKQGYHGLRTPDNDTVKEKMLRDDLQRLMEEIDPKYRDANLPQLGLGLGQMGAMVGTAFVPFVGKPLAVLGAGLMGAGEQAGRIAEYEERTGEDVTSGKEKMALAMGLGIGFTEMAPWSKAIPAKFANRFNIFSKSARKKLLQEAAEKGTETWGEIAGDIVQSSLRQGVEEAAQEAGAGFMQSYVGKMLYDDEALANAGGNALKEAIIGGEVGAVGNVLLKIAARAGGRGLRGGWGSRVEDSLVAGREEILSGLTPEAIDRKYGGFLTDDTEDGVELRRQIASGETREILTEQAEARIAKIKSETDEGSSEQGRAIKKVEEQLTVALDDQAMRKLAIEMHEAGTLQGMPNAKVPETAEIDRTEEAVASVLDRVQSQNQVTEEDAAVVGEANVSGPAETATYNIHDVLDQIRWRLRPTESEVRTSQKAAIAEGSKTDERSASRKRALIDRLEERLQDIPEDIDWAIKEKEAVNADFLQGQEFDERLTEEQFFELNPDLAERLAEANATIEGAEQEAAKIRDRIETAEVSLKKLNQNIDAANQPAVLEERVQEAVDVLKEGEDNVLSVQERLLTKLQRDNLRALWNASKQIRLSDGTLIPMPMDATPAMVAEQHPGSEIVDVDAQLTARQVRDLVTGIFDGGLAQGVRVGYETERGARRTAPDWRADIENNGPPIYQVTAVGDQAVEDGQIITQEQLELFEQDPSFEAERVVREDESRLVSDLQAANEQMEAIRERLGEQIREAGRLRTENTALDNERQAIEDAIDGRRASETVSWIDNTGQERSATVSKVKERITEIEGRIKDNRKALDKVSPDRRWDEETRSWIEEPPETQVKELSEARAAIEEATNALRRHQNANRVAPVTVESPEVAMLDTQAEQRQRKKVFVDNARRIERGSEATPEETTWSRRMSEDVLSQVLGFRSLRDIGTHLDQEKRDQPTEIEFEELSDHVKDPATNQVVSDWIDNGTILTKKLAQQALDAKNIDVDVDEFAANTLGVELFADVGWDTMKEGEGHAIMSRILRTKIQETSGKSYLTPSTVTPAQGQVILSSLLGKTPKGANKSFGLGKKSKLAKGLMKRLDISFDQLSDYIDRAVTAGVLERVKGRVRFTTPEQFADSVQERRTKAAQEAAQIEQELRQKEEAGEAKPRSAKQRKQDAKILQSSKSIISQFKKVATNKLRRMGHPDAAVKIAISADSIYATVQEIVDDPSVIVQTRQYESGPHASVQDHGAMVVFNLSQMEISHKQKDGESDAAYVERLVGETAFHEGAHLYFLRDDLSIAEQESLERYGKKQHVPEDVLPDNTGPNKKTWRQWVESLYPDRSEAFITEETSVRILDALAKKQIPEAKSAGFLGKIKRELRARAESLISASERSDIKEVMRIFSRLQGGELNRRREAVKEKASGISSARLMERATEEQLKRLKAASGRSQAELDRAAKDIVQERSDTDYEPVSLVDSMLNDVRARREIADTPNTVLPIINRAAIEAGEISPEALNEYFAFTDKRQAPYQFLEGARYMEAREGNRPFERGVDAERLSETHGRSERKKTPGQDFIEAPFDHEKMPEGSDSEYMEGQEDYEESMEYTTGEMMRLTFADKRLPQWKSHAKALRDKALNALAQTSAMAAWRMHDNALNFLPGILKYGMLTYQNGGFSLDHLYAIDSATGEYKRDEAGNKIPVKGLREIIRPILKLGKETQESARQYITAMRIIDVKNRLDQVTDPKDKKDWQERYDRLNPKKKDGSRWVSESKARDIIQQVEMSSENGDADLLAIKQFFEEYSDFNYHVIEFAYSTGLVDYDRKTEMQSMSYAPFYRDQGWQNSQPLSNQNNKNYKRGSPLIDMAVEGSFDPISEDLLGMMIKNVQAITRDGMWNIATQRTMRDEIQNRTAVEVDDEIDPALKGDELRARERVIEEKKRALSDQGFEDIVVKFKVDGVERRYRVKDSLLVTSIMNIGFSPSQAIEDFFGKVIKSDRVNQGLTKILVGSSQLLREAVTRSPPFIIKNIIRDSWQASVTFGGGPQLLLKSIANAIDPKVLDRAERFGLGIGVDWSPDPATAGDYETKMLKREQLHWSSPIKFGSNVWAGLGRMSRQSEIATRMAIFDKVMQDTNGDAAEAAYQATEIMNYGRRGSSKFFSVLTTMAPFMNGRIQGLDVVYRTHIGSADAPSLYDGAEAGALGAISLEQRQKNRSARVATAVARGSVFVMATMLYYLMVRDDEEYKNAREDMKNDWWLIPLGPGKPGIKIPIPFEVGTFYKVIPEQIMRAISEEEHDFRDVRDETIRQIRATLMLDLRPQAIRPMIDAVWNKDAFQRDTIVPQWMEDSVAAVEQKNEFTSELAVMLAGVMDKIPLVSNADFLTSPMKLEYMARQYVGTLGAYVMVMADRGVREVMGKNVVGTSADFGFKDNTIANFPILGDLLYDPSKGGGYQEDFYSLMQDIDNLIATMGQMEDGDPQGSREFWEKNQGVLNHERRMKYFNRAMDHHRLERSSLFERTDLSNEDKRRMYRRMLENRDDMLEEMLKIMADVRADRSLFNKLFGERPE